MRKLRITDLKTFAPNHVSRHVEVKLKFRVLLTQEPCFSYCVNRGIIQMSQISAVSYSPV